MGPTMKNLSELFAALRQPQHGRDAALTAQDACIACGADLRESESYHQVRVCHACRFHYTIGARARIEVLADPASFRESNRSLISIDPIAFAGTYKRRLFDEERRTGLADAIATGTARLDGRPVMLAVIDFRFMGGTIGSVVGEKLTQAMERAARRRRPVIAVIASGGARIQEGPLALLQMAKITLARQRLADARVPFLCVLTNPTLGAAYTGVAALADFLVAEPGALVGYAVARATGSPEGQTAEDLLRRGLIDEVADRAQQRELLAHVLTVLTARSRVSADDTPTQQPPHIHSGQAWNKVQIARHQQRPTALDFIARMASTFVELRGDGAGSDPATVTAGIGIIAGEAVVIVGQQRAPGGGDAGAWIAPNGFRKAARAIRLAYRFGLPVITLIDTPGADPRRDAADGLGPAIAECTSALAAAPVPTVAVLIGEGGSEAATAFGVADRVLMLEHAIYTVVSPERAAQLLHRDASRAEEVADSLHLTADACLELGVIDAVVAEPAGGAHADHDAAARQLRTAVLRALGELQGHSSRRLLRDRYRRYRAIGEYSGYIGTALAHEAGELRAALARRAGAAAARVRHPRRPPSASGESGALLVP
jgi:acetyl-CoA carboxylase carboxyl transferase subunit beta